MELPSGADKAIEDLVKKRNAVARIYQADADPANSTGDVAKPDTDVVPISGYAKADLSVSDGEGPGFLETQLTLYTAAGRIAYQSDEFELKRDPPVDSGPTTATQIEISHASKAFRSMHRDQLFGDSALVAVPPAIVPYLTDAEHNDPLALTPSDEILALAHWSQKPLVAVVPDSAFVDTIPVGATITVEDFAHSLATGETMAMSNTGDWIEIKPANPATARQYRCDRVALGRFLRSCMKESIPTLGEFAEFTTHADLANNAVVSAYLATAVSGYGNAGLSLKLTWDLYRIFAEFSPDQQASLIGGARLPVTALTSSQQVSFSRVAYGLFRHLRYGVGPIPLPNRFPSSSLLGSVVPGRLTRAGLPPILGYENEPTELLPNGVQASGYIEMTVGEEPFVSPYGPIASPPVVPRVIEVAQMARSQARSGWQDSGIGGAISIRRFKLGSRRVYRLTIHGSDRSYLTGGLFDFRLDLDSPAFAAGDLPSDWQSELARLLPYYQRRGQAQDTGSKAAPPPLLR